MALNQALDLFCESDTWNDEKGRRGYRHLLHHRRIRRHRLLRHLNESHLLLGCPLLHSSIARHHTYSTNHMVWKH